MTFTIDAKARRSSEPLHTPASESDQPTSSTPVGGSGDTSLWCLCSHTFLTKALFRHNDANFGTKLLSYYCGCAVSACTKTSTLLSSTTAECFVSSLFAREINYANYRFYLKVTLLLAKKCFFSLSFLLWCSLCFLPVFISFHKRMFGRLLKASTGSVTGRIPNL